MTGLADGQPLSRFSVPLLPGPLSWPERIFTWPRPLAGIAQKARLDGKPEPFDRTPLCPDERLVTAAQRVVPRHVGGIGRDSEQPDVLRGGQWPATWLDDLGWKSERPSSNRYLSTQLCNGILRNGP